MGYQQAEIAGVQAQASKPEARRLGNRDLVQEKQLVTLTMLLILLSHSTFIREMDEISRFY